MKRTRRIEAPILDINTDGRESVKLRTAARWLKMDERTVRARIESGDLAAVKDGKVYQIALADLRAYEMRRRLAS